MAVSRTATARLSARAMATPAAAGRATGTGRMRKSGRLRLGPASAYSRRSTAAARKPLMDDSAQKPFMPADAFGRSLSGFGVNILVSDVAATLAFLQEVLTVAVVHADAGFAVCRYGDHLWMLHGDATYHSNPLLALTGDGAIRGAGLEQIGRAHV